MDSCQAVAYNCPKKEPQDGRTREHILKNNDIFFSWKWITITNFNGLIPLGFFLQVFFSWCWFFECSTPCESYWRETSLLKPSWLMLFLTPDLAFDRGMDGQKKIFFIDWEWLNRHSLTKLCSNLKYCHLKAKKMVLVYHYYFYLHH